MRSVEPRRTVASLRACYDWMIEYDHLVIQTLCTGTCVNLYYYVDRALSPPATGVCTRPVNAQNIILFDHHDCARDSLGGYVPCRRKLICHSSSRTETLSLAAKACAGHLNTS